jgi:hypothetical protein
VKRVHLMLLSVVHELLSDVLRELEEESEPQGTCEVSRPESKGETNVEESAKATPYAADEWAAHE